MLYTHQLLPSSHKTAEDDINLCVDQGDGAQRGSAVFSQDDRTGSGFAGLSAGPSLWEVTAVASSACFLLL